MDAKRAVASGSCTTSRRRDAGEGLGLWHRPCDVLAQDGDERVEGMTCEGVGEAGDQGSPGVVERWGATRVSDPPGGERRPGALERTVHRWHGGAEEVGHFLRPPTKYLAQDQHRPLPWRELPEGDGECEPNFLPRDRSVGRIRSFEGPRVRRGRDTR